MNIEFCLENAKSVLFSDDYTCVVAERETILFTSRKRGVAPLVDFMKIKKHPCEYLLADKVIGKAAALLCIKAGINFVFAEVLSSTAKQIFDDNGVYYKFDNEVPAIQNRTRTGLCPMEGLSAGVETPDEMYNKVVIWLSSKKLS